MNADKYERIKANLETKGLYVLHAFGYCLRFLKAMKAEASYRHGHIMHIGEIPSATFFE